MQLAGLQKLTLLDYPGTVACIVFTSGCNFRCPFCHNAPLVLGGPQALLPESELLAFLEKRRGILDGVVVTGGEPLLHDDLPQLLEQIKQLGYRIKLDTNGSRPALLKRIVSEGLVDRVAMDIKNAPEAYAATVGLTQPDMVAITASKDFLMSGTVPYEFRTTVVRGLHTQESLLALARWIVGAKEYYLQQFKDSGDLVAAEGLCAFDEREMQEFADAVRPLIPAVKLRGM